MGHALIIDDNMIVSRAVRDYLLTFGFCSFDQVWSKAGAIAAAERQRPDIIVLGTSIQRVLGIAVIGDIAADHDVPVLWIASDNRQKN